MKKAIALFDNGRGNFLGVFLSKKSLEEAKKKMKKIYTNPYEIDFLEVPITLDKLI